MVKPFALVLLILFSVSAIAQQQPATPEEVTRGFYAWYLHQLNGDNMNPLKQKATALKYLTPQLYANAPRLIRRMDADIFICAQDFDNGWEQNFSISTPQIKNNSATTTVTLPSGAIDKITINVTLLKTVSGWRINKLACAN